MNELPKALLTALRGLLPADQVTTDPAMLQTYGKDWTKVYSPAPSAIVFPRTTAEVSAVLKLASEHGVAIVPSGGRTGLAGGAVAANGEVVLSLEKMAALGEVDRIGATVRVEAGAITEAVHAHCKPHGLTWPVDFASKGSSTVGGNLATNAGGLNVIRYGHTRHWVLGVEVVLMDGTILQCGGALEKDNTGVDLRQLFIGSEGTLGVITAATLKLTQLPGERHVLLFAVDGLPAVLELFATVRRTPVVLQAYEFFTDRCMARLFKHRGIKPPFAESASHYVLLEIDEIDDLDQFLTTLLETGLVADGVASKSNAEARALWALREGISESLSATGLPHKNDVALPIAKLTAFCAELEALFAKKRPDWEICLFGHIGDGNLHINTMKPDALSPAEFHARAHEADAELYTLIAKYEGSISAEHGIGLLKRDFLSCTRSPAEIAVMRTIKAALDPRGLLNPGKILT
jgi:FAD/FMN-containing dehydrogenase